MEMSVELGEMLDMTSRGPLVEMRDTMSSYDGLYEKHRRLLTFVKKGREEERRKRSDLLIVVPRDSHEVVEAISHRELFEERLVVSDDDELEVARVLALLNDRCERGSKGPEVVGSST